MELPGNKAVHLMAYIVKHQTCITSSPRSNTLNKVFLLALITELSADRSNQMQKQFMTTCTLGLWANFLSRKLAEYDDIPKKRKKVCFLTAASWRNSALMLLSHHEFKGYG